MASDFGNSKKRLLEESTEDETSIAIHERRYKVCDRLKLTILYLVLLSLVGSNYFFYSLYAQSRTQGHKLEPSQYAGYSTFTGLTHDTPTSYHYPTEYISSNETFADKLWDEIDVSRLVVALSDEWAEEHGLQRSVFRFPWDEKGTGVYYLKIFHDLHCVKSLRRAFTDYERGRPHQIPSSHVHHCLDALRQDILCTADDTPMPGTALPHDVGNGQVRMCKSWDKLVAWTREPEREACYKRLSDYGEVKHSIERYAYCPEESRHYPVMKAYYEKWGHLDPFGRGEDRL